MLLGRYHRKIGALKGTAEPCARIRFWSTHKVIRAYTTVRVQMMRVKISSNFKSQMSLIEDKS